ncbi:MAG: hypothetical protein ACOC7U_07815 [Spirochaetota bacterium]
MAGEGKSNSGTGVAGAVYFMGFIAAAVFYIQSAVSFGTGVLGFLKALVWPALLVYNLLEFLNM